MDYRILGPLYVARDGREVEVGTGKQQALLALLLLHANEPVSTDRLIDELWGPARAASSSKVLHNLVSKLRRLLGADLLRTRGQAYELRVAPGELDLDVFNDTVAKGRRAAEAGDPVRGATLLREALSLWRGPPLFDFTFEPFAQREIERLERLRLSVVADRVDIDLGLGRAAELVPELQELADAHPLEERIRGQLMLALYRAGRQAAALEVYRATRRSLVETLGLEPGPALKQLEQAMLRHDPALEASGVHGFPTRRRTALLAVLLVGTAAIVAGLVAATRVGRHGAEASAAALQAIDPHTNRPANAIPVGNLPTRIAVGGRRVWTASSYGGTVSVVDTRAMKVASTYAVSTATRALGSLPDPFGGIAASETQAWVVFGGVVARVAPTGNIARAMFEADAYSDVSDLAVAGHSIWITSERHARVTKVDAETLRVVARLTVTAVPISVAATPRAVWIAGFDAASHGGVLLRVDPRRLVVTETIPLPGIPGDVAVGYGAIWVTINSADALWRVDPTTGSVVRTIEVGAGPVAVALGEGSVWIADAKDGTISRLDPDTNRVGATIHIGGTPRDVAVTDGRVWVATP
jgi:YVTN family beta-propeller protein